METVDYTVAIPHRNEGAELAKTVENIQETQDNCVHIITREDKENLGTAATRHAAVQEAATEIVITCDAHMRFQPGALDELAAFIAADRTRVACLTCHSNPDLSFDENPLYGADLFEMGDEYALEPKWRKVKAPGEIACLMGACYGFARSLYESLGSPWKLGRGWGCDETLLSIPARLAGGSVHVLAAECAHLLRRPDEVMYRQTDAELEAIWYTRFALLEYLRPDNLDQLRRLMQSKCGRSFRMRAEVMHAADQLSRVKKLTFPEYRARWLVTDFRVEAPARELRQAVRIAARSGLPSVQEFGIRCPHCKQISDRHRVTTTYPNGNRRRLCAFCGMPFITRFGMDSTGSRPALKQE